MSSPQFPLAFIIVHARWPLIVDLTVPMLEFQKRWICEIALTFTVFNKAIMNLL